MGALVLLIGMAWTAFECYDARYFDEVFEAISRGIVCTILGIIVVTSIETFLFG